MSDREPEKRAPSQPGDGQEEIFVTEIPDDSPVAVGTAPKPPKSLRGAAVVGARVAAGAVALLVAGAVVATAAFAPLPVVRSTPPSTLVTPVATARQLVCPGSLLRLADATGKGASSASTLGSPRLGTASTQGTVRSAVFPNSEAKTGGTQDAPRLLSTGRGTPGVLLAGAQVQSVKTADYTGLATAVCTAPSSDSWLAGGSTEVGRTTLLTLNNASEVPATVALALWGRSGALTAPGLTGIVVAARSQKVLSLAGFAPGEPSPVVHVRSRGGQVTAALQESIVRGLDPGGIDQLGAGAPPARSVVIPGIVVSGTASLGRRLGQPGFEDLQTVLRAFVPGDKEAALRVSIVPEDRSSHGATFSSTVDAKSVTDLPISDIGDGRYTVTINSSEPIIAGARVSAVAPEASGSHTDFAWSASSVRLRTNALVVVPGSAASTLHLSNAGKSNVTVNVAGPDGAARRVAVGSGASADVPLKAGSSYRLSGYADLFASVTTASRGGIGAFGVQPAEKSSTPLRVYP